MRESLVAEQAESKAVEDAANLQSDLAKQGEALLKKLAERRQRPPRPTDKPAEPKPEEPKPEGGGEQPKDEGHAG